MIYPAPRVTASETVTFQYDALGRLIGSDHIGGVAGGMKAGFTYDPAGNRKTSSTEGSPGQTSTTVVVVPLNGFTVIPVVPR